MSLPAGRPFLPEYRLLPHRLVNGAAGILARARRPRVLIQRMIRAWIVRGGLDLSDFEPGPFESLEALFLRRLRPGARPPGQGVVSPVDGEVVDAGTLAPWILLHVKGRAVPAERLVGGGPLGRLVGGAYVVVFLPPGGYHRVHMPDDGEIVGCRRVRGRFFPMSPDESRNVRDVYLRNERVALRCRLDRGGELYVVLVGASLVGGIQLEGLPRRSWARGGAETPVSLPRRRGDEIGRFTFGSTVIVLAEGPAVPLVAAGETVRMGRPLIAPAGTAPGTGGPGAGS